MPNGTRSWECSCTRLFVIIQFEGKNKLDSSEINNQQQSMRLRMAIAHWAVCLVINIFLVGLFLPFDTTIAGYVGCIFYFCAGIYLNRTVLRKIIEWHPIYNTLHDVSSGKLRFFIFWPIQYFGLFVRLCIDKVL